ncbi:unnamed protein product [Candidula unifasciata]|uniref:Cytochrome b-c1 complex subunit 2, mitochondrial n=1 Tax=Candidula unifasciata TaxID=100452 RepID=A0A8S3ZI03_9EUPU|nr:unnamed protein product [Candidula unifasciata]
MAVRISRPLLLPYKGRMFSAVAQPEPRLTADEKEPRAYIKKLSNGMLVGTIESQSPLSRLAVVVNAGSRYESGDNLGVAHVLRHATKLRTENLSNLGITRSTQQLGADLTCQGTREHLFYKGVVTRNCAAKVVEILRELTTKQTFKDWELEEIQADPNGLKLDLSVLKTRPDIRVIELLHAAGFRDTLGRSLYAPEFMIGKYTHDQLLHYVKTYFSSGHELEQLASEFEPYSSIGVPQTNATFYGGEIRENTGGPLSYVAFAYGGPSVGQFSKDSLALEVLKQVLGVGPHVKYSTGTVASNLGKLVASVTSSPFAISSIGASYSDAGLLGLSLVAPNSEIDKVVRTAVSSLRSVLTSGVSDQDVQKAKTKLKSEIAMLFLEHPDNLLSWLGEQTLNSDHILTPQEVYRLVDPITTGDINSAAKKLATSKPALAVTGNTNNVPYLDRLVS